MNHSCFQSNLGNLAEHNWNLSIKIPSSIQSIRASPISSSSPFVPEHWILPHRARNNVTSFRISRIVNVCPLLIVSRHLKEWTSQESDPTLCLLCGISVSCVTFDNFFHHEGIRHCPSLTNGLETASSLILSQQHISLPASDHHHQATTNLVLSD